MAHDIGWAMAALQRGHVVTRFFWHGRDAHGVKCEEKTVIYQELRGDLVLKATSEPPPIILLRGPHAGRGARPGGSDDGTHMWRPRQDDLLAKDWVLVVELRIVQVLDAVGRGEIIATPKGDPHPYSGDTEYTLSNGWKMTIFIDAGEWDYIASIEADGAKAEYEDIYPELQSIEHYDSRRSSEEMARFDKAWGL